MLTLFKTLLMGCSLFYFISDDFNKVEIVKMFYKAKNNRDTAVFQSLLHDDFRMISDDSLENGLTKTSLVENMWCKACLKDTLEIISVEDKEGVVHIVTEHKSEVLRLLEIPYFQDLDRVYFKEDKIIKIERDTLPGYAAQSREADKKFEKFSLWMYHHYPDANINEVNLLPVLEKYSKRIKKKHE